VSKPRAASSRLNVAPVAALAINPFSSSVTVDPGLQAGPVLASSPDRARACAEIVVNLSDQA
jgi:hypothetical protein